MSMWVEKYRPKRLDDVVGQEHVIVHLKEVVVRRAKIHMLFSGPPGCGKTSVAYALANELGVPILELNASDERGINVIRERVKKFAFTAGEKIILLDEADSMTDDAQHALRRIMEKAEKAGSIFILTANEDWRIIDPIKSRCAIFKFRKLTREEVLKVLINILKAEDVQLKLTEDVKKALLFLVDYVEGDLRKAINILETLVTSSKTITVENIKMLTPPPIATRVLELAISGRLEEALKTLEDMYLQNKLDSHTTINDLYQAIIKSNYNPLVKAGLLVRLREVETAIRGLGCNPLIQLSGFLGSAYIYSTMGKKSEQ